MKIIKNNAEKQKCIFCGSILEVLQEDIEYSEYRGLPFYTCPCCGKRNLYLTKEIKENMLNRFHESCKRLFEKN